MIRKECMIQTILFINNFNKWWLENAFKIKYEFLLLNFNELDILNA